MAIIYFGITVRDITDEESKELVDTMVKQNIVEIGDQDWVIDELGYDGRSYFVDHLDSDRGDGWHYVFHAASDQSNDEGWLTIRFNWYDAGAQARGRVSYSRRFDEFIEVLHNLSTLRDEIHGLTDKEVSVGAIEER